MPGDLLLRGQSIAAPRTTVLLSGSPFERPRQQPSTMDWVTRPAPLNDRFRRHHPRLHAGAVQHAAPPGHVRRYRQRAGVQRGPSAAPDRMKRHAYVLAFNLGRISVYGFLGCSPAPPVVSCSTTSNPTLWRRVASAVAGLSLMPTGLYTRWLSMRYAGRVIGRILWRRIEPIDGVCCRYVRRQQRSPPVWSGVNAVRAGILFRYCSPRRWATR